MKLLLAEDDAMFGQALVSALEQAGYIVSWYKDGESAELAALYQPFDVAVFDVNLPKQSGLSVLNTLRIKQKKLPVLILTAQNAPSAKVSGLDAGADDFVSKPFDLDELLARLRAITRRNQGRSANVLYAGDVEYNPVTHVVMKNAVTVEIPPKELKLLALLLRSKGKPLDKPHIEAAIYGDEESFESNTVEVLVYSLRKKLGHDFIKTKRGLGYIIPE